jgi:hypothetical protein
MRIPPRRVAIGLGPVVFLAWACTAWYHHPTTIRSGAGVGHYVFTNPDGSAVASVGADNVIEVRDLATNRQLTVIGVL